MKKAGIILPLRRLTPRWRLGLPVALALRVLAFAAAAEIPSKPVVVPQPAEIGVLLLPSTDTEPWAANVLAQRQDVVRSRLEHDFLARGFTMYHETLARAAAEKPPKIDLADPTKRTAENLDTLAQRTGADWVVSVEVQDVAENPKLSKEGEFHCFCRVDLKVWDATKHEWRADGIFTGYDQGGGTSPVWRFLNSIDDAAHVAIASVLHQYPAVIDMGEPMRYGDYLAGQAQPFVPKVGEPLGGLKVSGPQ